MESAVQMSRENLPAMTLRNKLQVSDQYKRMQAFRLQRIYIVAALFIMLGITQLAVIKMVHIHMFDSLPVPSLMWIVITLVCLILMVFTELFNQFPINWTLGIVSVESVTLCTVCYKWNHLPIFFAGVIVISVLVLHTTLYVMGAYLPLFVLPGYYAMLYITIVFIVIYIFFSIIVHAVGRPNLHVIIETWSFLYMMPLVLYTATVIHHRRLPDMLSDEYILSATVIASFFLFTIYLCTTSVTYTCRMLGNIQYHYAEHK